MTFSPLTEAAPSASTAAGRDVRLALKPHSASDTGHVDGAWWPRSRDLVAELPALVRGLAIDVGHLNRVSYRLPEWDPAPRRTGVGASLVHLAGYRSLSPNTVNLLVGGQWVVLLVVPPETAEQSAEHALGTAGAPNNTDSVVDLLADPAPRRIAALPSFTTSTDKDSS